MLNSKATAKPPHNFSEGVSRYGEQGALIKDMTPKRGRQRGLMSLARKRRTETKEAKHIQRFLSEFDVESEEKGAPKRAEDVLYMAAERRYSLPLAAEARDGFWLHLGEGPGVDFAASEIAGVDNEADLQSGAILSTNYMASAALADYACVDRSEPSMNPVITEAAPIFTNT